MHEITLCQRALEIIEQQAKQHAARRVTEVWIKVGAFSCVEPAALTFCFDLVCRGTLAEGCTLPAIRDLTKPARASLPAMQQRQFAHRRRRRHADSAAGNRGVSNVYDMWLSGR